MWFHKEPALSHDKIGDFRVRYFHFCDGSLLTDPCPDLAQAVKSLDSFLVETAPVLVAGHFTWVDGCQIHSDFHFMISDVFFVVFLWIYPGCASILSCFSLTRMCMPSWSLASTSEASIRQMFEVLESRYHQVSGPDCWWFWGWGHSIFTLLLI